MEFITQVIGDAFEALADFGPELAGVLGLTLVISLVSTFIGVVVGVPLGVGLALGRFRGRRAITTLVHVGMGIPPVLVGLFLLLLFWDSGPFGSLGLVFTPTAMVIAQVLLALPIAAWFMADWLQGFEYRISEVYIALFGGIAAAVALVIAWGTVSGHAIRVARTNPIQALRYE